MILILLVALATAEPATDLSKTETSMVNAINKYRADRKLPPMVADPILMKVARHRVSRYDHHAFGCWSWDEARREGFRGPVTDNLAQGYTSGEDAVGDAHHGWGDEHHTVGHDMQLKGYTKVNGRWINQHFDRVGVAHSGKNWIAVFGREDSK